MAMHDVANETAHMAVRALREEGLVVSAPGRGLFVAEGSQYAKAVTAATTRELAELPATGETNAESLVEIRRELERINERLERLEKTHPPEADGPQPHSPGPSAEPDTAPDVGPGI